MIVTAGVLVIIGILLGLIGAYQQLPILTYWCVGACVLAGLILLDALMKKKKIKNIKKGIEEQAGRDSATSAQIYSYLTELESI